jgi:hypothetical protein
VTLELELGEEVRSMINYQDSIIILTNFGNCWIMKRTQWQDNNSWVLQRLFSR